ncbi:hypothetical protein D3C75_936580 [compost metagenome]
MPVQCAHAFAVGFAEVAHVHAGAGGFAVHAGRLVQQQGYRFQRFGTGTRQQFDALLLDLELRLLDHHAIDRYPASFNVLLGLAAGAAELLDEAFGQADGFGHGAIRKAGKGLHCTCLQAVDDGNLCQMRHFGHIARHIQAPPQGTVRISLMCSRG